MIRSYTHATMDDDISVEVGYCQLERPVPPNCVRESHLNRLAFHALPPVERGLQGRPDKGPV